MNKTLKGILFWTPRIGSIVFVLFISLFAFDVFEAGLGFWGTAGALLLHLLPSILLAAAIAVAWRWEWVGAVPFIGFAAWYLVSVRGEYWIAYAVVAGLPAAIGLLFLIGWIWRKQVRGGEGGGS